MSELSGILIAAAGFIGLFVLFEKKILTAIRLGKVIAEELTLKKRLSKVRRNVAR
jgi:hypothetical protein